MTSRTRTATCAVLVLLLTLPAVLAAPLTSPLQQDAGVDGDAPGALADARPLPGAGVYDGVLVALDDTADAYALALPRETRLVVHLEGSAEMRLDLLDPDGVVLASTGGVLPVPVEALTDVAGAWKLRVVSQLGGPYRLDVRATPTWHDDGGTLADAGFRTASALVYARNVTYHGNLSSALTDCTDVWRLPVAEGERVFTRFVWTAGEPVGVGVLLPDSKDRVRVLGSNFLNETLTATANTTWTFTLRYPPAGAGGCRGTSAAYVTQALDADPLPPPPPPVVPVLELHQVEPGMTRPGKEVTVRGRNLTHTAFTLGGVPLPVRSMSLDGWSAKVALPFFAPGVYDLVATRDGSEALLENATVILAPADLAVVSLADLGPRGAAVGPATADDPLATRDVRAVVRNLAEERSEAYRLRVYVHPAQGGTPVGGYLVHESVHSPLWGGEERVHDVLWSTRGNAGSFRLRAEVLALPGNVLPMQPHVYDSDATNDARVTWTYVFVDPGVGARPPTLLA